MHRDLDFWRKCYQEGKGLLFKFNRGLKIAIHRDNLTSNFSTKFNFILEILSIITFYYIYISDEIDFSKMNLNYRINFLRIFFISNLIKTIKSKN